MNLRTLAAQLKLRIWRACVRAGEAKESLLRAVGLLAQSTVVL